MMRLPGIPTARPRILGDGTNPWALCPFLPGIRRSVVGKSGGQPGFSRMELNLRAKRR